MGRSYIVDDAVEGYLSKLCKQQASPITGLLIGQSSTQRDFVIMATRTPQREESTAVTGICLDKEWITEHARQVSRMLPGGLSIMGVFIITDNDAKDTITTLRQSVARPADWKYQSGVSSSWITVSCCLNVDMLVPLPDNRTITENMDVCLKEELKAWAYKIKSGVCLIDGKRLQKDIELTAGQKKNVRHMCRAQLLITPENKRLTDTVQWCGGTVSVRGAIHSRIYIHSNKPKANLAEKVLKRDVVSTVATRVQMLLEELMTSEEESKGSRDEHHTEQFCLPRRVFCPVKATGPVCVCDYQFSDEGLSEVTDRLKEMLDIDAAEEDLDTRQEIIAEVIESDVTAESTVESAEVMEPKRNNYIGVAIATAVALLATAASMLYLTDM